ncbi:MAG: cheA, partial [Halothiobacillaceae bacterium]
TSAAAAEPIVTNSIIGDHAVTTDCWHISVRFPESVLRDGMDPISFLRYLEQMGELVDVVVVNDRLAEVVGFDPESCYLGVEIRFRAETNKEEIEKVFEFIREESEINILPPRAMISHYAKMLQELPEDNLKLGDLLVASGALTAQELTEALAMQRMPLGSGKRIGEVLIEQNYVHRETVDDAVDRQKKVVEKKGGVPRTIRIDADKLDAQINLVGELVIAGARANLLAQPTKEERLIEAISVMGRLVEEIRDSSLKLRMVPIGDAFNRFQRVVHDVSGELRKSIKLEIHGAETELDKTVIEKISDPLMHLVRNAMDHGIESPEERRLNGKTEEGVLTLNAYHDSGSIVIQVSDDGRGLSRERIIAKALEKGLISEGQPLSESEVYQLVFEPGFSTVSQVSNLSGRGVGMDVVKKNIMALRGMVDLKSQPNGGTVVTIRLPLTLAIIDGFLVGVGSNAYVIPLDMVVECIELTAEDFIDANNSNYINLRGAVLPFIKLRDIFEEEGDASKRENIVVVQYGEMRAGLVVDALLGEFQTVIKPLGKIFQQVQGISGSTILGSGEVALILDVPSLIGQAVLPKPRREVAPTVAPALGMFH